jgi:hypothetical protein
LIFFLTSKERNEQKIYIFKEMMKKDLNLLSRFFVFAFCDFSNAILFKIDEVMV